MTPFITLENIKNRLSLTDKSLLVTEAEYLRRICICETCEYKSTKMNLKSCGVCHCFLELKTRYTKSTCPMELW